MTVRRRRRQRGSAVVEFTLVGLGLVFVLISIFEMARGMWIYHTLAHASKEATRYLIVRGKDCQRQGGACDATLNGFSQKIRNEGIGLLPGQLEVQVYVNGTQVVGSAGSWVTMQSLSGNTAAWSTTAERKLPVQVSFRYLFRSALSMLWPGGGRVQFGAITLGASSWDTMQF